MNEYYIALVESIELATKQGHRDMITPMINKAMGSGSINAWEAQTLKQKYTEVIRKKFRAIGNQKTISLKGLEKMKKKEYIIKRFDLAEGSLGLLCGTGNSGKTMLVQYLACCVSSGKPMFGSFEVKKGSVNHVDMEQSEDQTQRRYERLANFLELTELAVSRVTLQNRLDSKPEFLEQVEEEMIDLCSESTLTIIDSLKAVSAAEENSADIEVVLKLLKRVAEKTSCAILLVHHKGKGKDAKQSGRGHSSIYDSVDVQIDLDVENEVYQLSCAKNRDGRFFDGIKYQLLDKGNFNFEQNCSEILAFDLLQDDVKNKKADMKGKVLEVLSTEGELKQGDLFEKVKGDRNRFIEILALLIKMKHVEEKKGYRGAIIYSITEEGKNIENWK